MKLDSRAIRYLTADDWRVLQAVRDGPHQIRPRFKLTLGKRNIG